MITLTPTDKACICKTARALGFSKRSSQRLTDQIYKWSNNNGIEWFIAREKDLKTWYLKRLSGDQSSIPDWVSHDKKGLPLGIYREVFTMKNKARALTLLSIGSIFQNKIGQYSQAQTRKCLSGIFAVPADTINRESLRDDSTFVTRADETFVLEHLTWTRVATSRYFFCDDFPLHDRMFIMNYWSGKGRPALTEEYREDLTKEISSILDPEKLEAVSPEYYRGSLPEKDGKGHSRRVSSLRDARKFLDQDLKSNFPLSVAESLDRLGRPDLVPDCHWSGGIPGFGKLKDTLVRKHGRITIVNEPFFKPRMIGNPNRILQYYLEPLATLFDLLADCKNNCVYDQEAGKQWAQLKLREGVELASSDLTSASDLFEFSKVWRSIWEEFRLQEVLTEESKDHLESYMHLFYSSVNGWVLNPTIFDKHAPDKEHVVGWQRGWCLGTRASFGFLTLANICCARKACRECGIPYDDAFRVVGDDIVMISAIEPAYTRFVEEIGGSINQSKTMRSSLAAEFAGSIITPDYIMPKNLKFKHLSMDHRKESLNVLKNSYASVYDIFRLTDLVGKQAIGLLNKKQKRLYHQYMMIPGVVVSGPWSQNSHGEPLYKRVHYYETVLEPNKLQKDTQEKTLEQSLLEMSIQESPLLKDNLQSQSPESQPQEAGGTEDRPQPKSWLDEEIEVVGHQYDLPSSTLKGTDDHYQTPIVGTPPTKSLLRERPHGDPRLRNPGPDEFLERKSSLVREDKLPAKGSGKPTFKDDFDPLGKGTDNRYQRPVVDRSSYEDVTNDTLPPEDYPRIGSICNRLESYPEMVGPLTRESVVAVLHYNTEGLDDKRISKILHHISTSISSKIEHLSTITVSEIIGYSGPSNEAPEDPLTKDL